MPPRLRASNILLDYAKDYTDYRKAFLTTTGAFLTSADVSFTSTNEKLKLNPHSPKYTHMMLQAIDGIPICYVPKKIKQNGPATIIFWQDGTKTVIKLAESDPDGGVYHAFCAALAKKIYKTNSQLKRVIDRKTE